MLILFIVVLAIALAYIQSAPYTQDSTQEASDEEAPVQEGPALFSSTLTWLDVLQAFAPMALKQDHRLGEDHVKRMASFVLDIAMDMDLAARVVDAEPFYQRQLQRYVRATHLAKLHAIARQERVNAQRLRDERKRMWRPAPQFDVDLVQEGPFEDRSY